ncbi:hypothetical protein KIF24_01810 [Micromonospora sp. Llam7]|nr:hypothetical protein [Micromonospora tarapacensis]
MSTAVLLLAACGSETATTTDATPPAVATSAAAAPAVGGAPPIPDEATTAAYIDALKKIDPDIVGKKDDRSMVNRGRDQCTSVSEWPDDEARLIDLTNKRFTAPTHPEGFGKETAKEILKVVHTYICP